MGCRGNIRYVRAGKVSHIADLPSESQVSGFVAVDVESCGFLLVHQSSFWKIFNNLQGGFGSVKRVG